MTYYLSVLLSSIGVIWDLRPVPEHILCIRRIELAQAA